MDNNDLIDTLQGLGTLSPDQEKAYQIVNIAADVDMTVRTPGWLHILGMLEEIRDDAENLLLDQPPGEPEKILPYHAAAFAVRKTYQTLLENIQAIRNERTAALEVLNRSEEPEENYYN